MKALDRFLQDWRIKKAVEHFAANDKILDVGTHDGALFLHAGGEGSIGVDPNLVETKTGTAATFVKGYFPGDVAGKDFNAIALLAVIEHLDNETQLQLAKDCFAYLKPGGKVVVTTPSPFVDKILDVLFFLRIIDGMGGTHEDHYGFEPMDTIPVFEAAGFTTNHVSRFQLGLNNLFVFRKPDV